MTSRRRIDGRVRRAMEIVAGGVAMAGAAL
jgi:hypothetical protein